MAKKTEEPELGKPKKGKGVGGVVKFVASIVVIGVFWLGGTALGTLGNRRFGTAPAMAEVKRAKADGEKPDSTPTEAPQPTDTEQEDNTPQPTDTAQSGNTPQPTDAAQSGNTPQPTDAPQTGGTTEDPENGGQTTIPPESKPGSVQVVVYGRTRADIILENAYVVQGNREGCDVIFGTQDGYYHVILNDYGESELECYIGEAENEEHNSFDTLGKCEYSYNGDRLTFSVDMGKYGRTFNFYEVTEYRVAYYGEGGTFFTVSAKDVVTDLGGGDEPMELNIGFDVEIIGVKTAQLSVDISDAKEGTNTYQIYFDAGNETYLVELEFIKNESAWYAEGRNYRAVNAEKTEFEPYEIARSCSGAHYDEATGKLFVHIEGLAGCSFLDIEQYRVRRRYEVSSFETVETERIFDKAGVARLRTTPAEDFEYMEDENGGIVILLYIGDSAITHIIFPDKIDGKPVTAIGGGKDVISTAELRSIIIPAGVQVIGEYAFYGCWQMTDVVLPEGLREIRPAAFVACNALSNINFPDSVEFIGQDAFGENYELESVTLPKNAKVEENAFSPKTAVIYR